MKTRSGLASLVSIALLSPLSAFSQSPNNEGQQLFDGSCARCHGFDAAGAIGPNLQRSALVRAESATGFKALVQNGLPDRGMPATPGLSDRELSSISAYVRSLRSVDTVAQSAQAGRGKEIYRQQNCGSCHIVKGEGKGAGPELTDIGVKRKPEQLRQDLTDPAASLPQLSAGMSGTTSGHLPVRVLTVKGQEISGLRISEDAFSIQLRDADQRLHTFKKVDLKQIDKQFDRSSMPRVTLAATQLEDLVAYLSSLRGVK